MLFLVLWRPGRAMSYTVATRVNTSFNQAIKDPSQRRCGYSNLGKIVIKSVAARFVAARDLAGKFRFLTSSEPLPSEQKVARCLITVLTWSCPSVP
jgi:hypothetical protein